MATDLVADGVCDEAAEEVQLRRQLRRETVRERRAVQPAQRLQRAPVRDGLRGYRRRACAKTTLVSTKPS